MTGNPQISERETEILRLIATGATNQQIANKLTISVNTVKVHVRNIFGKIGVASRAEAAMYAVRVGLVRLEQVRTDAPSQPWTTPDTGPQVESDLDIEEIEAPASPADPTSTLVPSSVLAVATAAPAWRRAGFVLATGRWRTLTLVALASLAVIAAVVISASRAGAPGLTPTLPSPSGQALQRWRELSALPLGRAALGLAAYSYEGRSFLYAIGGTVGSTADDQVLRLDLATGVWVAMSRKPTAVTDVRAVVVGGRIYVPGGKTASGAISAALEAYDPQRDRWYSLAPMPGPRSGYALATVEGKLYVIGGWDGTTYSGDVWQYNPDDDTWRPRSPMPTARAHAAVGVSDQQVFVVGGEAGAADLSVNERYSPSSDHGGAEAWSTKAPIPAPVSHSDATVAGSLLMVVEAVSPTGQLLVYNPQTDSWHSSPIPLPPLRDVRVQALGGRLYIVGGSGEGGASARVYEYQAISSVFLPALPGLQD